MAARYLIFNVSPVMAMGIHQIVQVQWKKVSQNFSPCTSPNARYFLLRTIINDIGTAFFVLFFHPIS